MNPIPMVLAAVLAGFVAVACSTSPTREPLPSLDCAQVPEPDPETPEFLRAPTQVAQITTARGGLYRWKNRTLAADELRDVLLGERASLRVTEVHLLAGGEPQSIAHLVEVGNIAAALCARAFFERNGQLQELRQVQ